MYYYAIFAKSKNLLFVNDLVIYYFLIKMKLQTITRRNRSAFYSESDFYEYIFILKAYAIKFP